MKTAKKPAKELASARLGPAIVAALILSILLTTWSSPVQGQEADPDSTQDGVIDLGDITGVTKTQYPVHRLNAPDDAVDYFKFSITEPRSVTMGVRQLDRGASITLQDEEGETPKHTPDNGARNNVFYIGRPIDFGVGGKPAETQANRRVSLFHAEAEGAEHVRRLGNAGRADYARGRRNPWLECSENVLRCKSVKPQVGVAGVAQVTQGPIYHYRMAAAFHQLNERVALSSNARSLAPGLCRCPCTWSRCCPCRKRTP